MGLNSPEIPVSRPDFLPTMSGVILGFSKETWYSLMNLLLLPRWKYVFKHGVFEIRKALNSLEYHLLGFYSLAILTCTNAYERLIFVHIKIDRNQRLDRKMGSCNVQF